MSSYKEGAIHQLANQLERLGFTDEELHNLGDISILKLCLRVLRGTHEIRPISHRVDLSLIPRLPFDDTDGIYEDLRIIEHKGDRIVTLEYQEDRLYIDNAQYDIFRSEEYKIGYNICYEIRRALPGDDQCPMNANILAHLMEHKELIPYYWEHDAIGNDRCIVFPDTKFGHQGRQYICYLCWDHGNPYSYWISIS